MSPHQEYISRHVTDMYNSNLVKADNRVSFVYHFVETRDFMPSFEVTIFFSQQIGYLWSWNHMIGRRWKGSNQATNDEAFQDKLLLDFRKFCANNEDRLLNFWNSCRAKKNKNEAAE